MSASATQGGHKQHTRTPATNIRTEFSQRQRLNVGKIKKNPILLKCRCLSGTQFESLLRLRLSSYC